MAKTNWKIGALLLCALLVFSVMVQKQAAAAGDETPAVKIAEKEGLGRFLTDSDGMTLYRFTKDSTNMSACSGFCVERWPIFYTEVTYVPDDCQVSDFGVITREDGKKQTTYKGMPLYYFEKDKEPGDTKGQGVYDSWYVVAP
jgi:predicted lipoprotein with Yx(FWY)xxD motif